MSANPSALVRLYEEFEAVEGQLRLGGIYAGKPGYHNTRNNHIAGRSGGSPGDYSIQASYDERGDGNKAAAIDLTFADAQRSDFKTISKYTKRLINAMRDRDKRLFHNGDPVVRECFGNADDDREVEGWSMYRGYAVSSDSSHLWHIHISFHRWAVENWDACRGVLDVLLNRDSEEDDFMAMFKDKAEYKEFLGKVIDDRIEEALTKQRELGENQKALTGHTKRSLVASIQGAWAQIVGHSAQDEEQR